MSTLECSGPKCKISCYRTALFSLIAAEHMYVQNGSIASVGMPLQT